MKVKTITLALILPLLSQTGFGQFTGDQDTDFGTSGRIWYNYAGHKSVFTKLVLDENSEGLYYSGSLESDEGAFDASIVKATMDGDLDDELTDGTIKYNPFFELGGLDEQFESVAIQENGKMVAAGYVILEPGNSDLMVARFNTDGSFDPTFNGGSLFLSMEDGLDFATDVVLQDDGKILVIGSYQVGPLDLDLFFIRMNSDGSLDGTFGDEGVQLLDTYMGIELVHTVTVLENGNILVVGQAGDDALVIQLDEEGNFDTDFSGDGVLNFKVNSLQSVVNTAVELESGELLLGGNTFNEGEDGNNGFVIKTEANGNFVLDFDGDDATLNLIFEEEMGLDTTFTLTDLEVFENGQILVSGDYHTETEDVALLLINEDGTIDTEFGTEGMRIYNLSGGVLPNANSQIEIASNGRVYISAKVINGSFEDVVTWRLFADYTAIEEQTKNNLEFNLYPNPGSNQLNVVFDNSLEKVGIQIVDLSGRILHLQEYTTSDLNGNTLSLTSAIENLPAGIYQITVLSENGVGNKTFIKQ